MTIDSLPSGATSASLAIQSVSGALDTDWIAKLADVAPDGSESIITEGYLRASHRTLDKARSTIGNPYHDNEHPTPLEPGAVLSVRRRDLPDRVPARAAGHRLQLRLTTFDMPTHLPAASGSTATTRDRSPSTPLQPATNTVQEGGKRPSSLLLPVLGG